MNRYWHAEPFLKLAEGWGCSVDDAKLVAMGTFWGWKTVRGYQVPERAHTSQMTVKEGTVFLEWLIPFAAEQGIEIFLPHEWKDAA